LRQALRQLARLLEIPRPETPLEKAKAEIHELIPETSKTFGQARRYTDLTQFEFEESPDRERSSLRNLETTLTQAENVFTAATLLASERAWNDWQQLPPDTKIAESELRNAAANRVEHATTNDPAKGLDDASLSIALTRWNETIVRRAPDSRTALVSQIATEVQDLG
jgi:hypothetical protein